MFENIYTKYAASKSCTTDKFLEEVNSILGGDALDYFTKALYQEKWADPKELRS